MAETHRLYVKGKHLSYQRSKRTNNPSVSLIQVEGVSTPEEAKFYLGKRVAFVYRASKEIRGSKIRVIWGKITRTHGNSGVVRASFRKNLPPKTFGASVRVMLYPSNI
ncbi:60S ribosomal protein L33-B [Wickerhamiella sorbophila]|uniref:60S ribosomal protein L33-B n=1 Tax=Wickerhamiella sorbophila TaxID=45607 RepID=A0A2T0FN37_9ASCO|nr:60S ribosomal protein L33-B [Wickerhamiella sorbophila]PRT56379.1 60S ribosomal protein L33-B [Wickerhamiella sorbophila]